MITNLEHETHAVIGAAMEVHRYLGPGLLESAYALCFCHELTLRGIAWHAEVPIALEYKGLHLPNMFRADLVVGGAILVEIKVVSALLPVHEAQALTYMRLLGLEVGLLINFNVPVLRQGIQRLVLDRR